MRTGINKIHKWLTKSCKKARFFQRAFLFKWRKYLGPKDCFSLHSTLTNHHIFFNMDVSPNFLFSLFFLSLTIPLPPRPDNGYPTIILRKTSSFSRHFFCSKVILLILVWNVDKDQMWLLSGLPYRSWYMITFRIGASNPTR